MAQLELLDLDVPKPELFPRFTFWLGSLERDVAGAILSVAGHAGKLRSGY